MLLADDVDVRSVIQTSLSFHGFYVVTAKDHAPAEAMLSSDAPCDAIVISLCLESRNVLDFIETLAGLHPRYGPIVIAGAKDIDGRAECIVRGAMYVIDNPIEVSDLLHVVAVEVRRMRRNRAILGRWLRQKVSEHRESSHEHVRWSEHVHNLSGGWKLTNREFDVLLLLLDGSTTRKVGLQLGISRETVRSHVRRIREKSQMTIADIRSLTFDEFGAVQTLMEIRGTGAFRSRAGGVGERG